MLVAVDAYFFFFPEGDVMSAMENICTMEHFKVYDFIPPKMIMGVSLS